MDLFCDARPLRIDLVYADADHPENIFGVAAYASAARLILHKDLARVVIAAARLLYTRHGWIIVLKDGLRTLEAQERLIDTDIVRANPQWLKEPRLLSAPGQGAHPRGMAIDVSVLNKDGYPVDMGTVFDAMLPESARAYEGFDREILDNRAALETAFTDAADSLSLPLLPLPSEWWDFRFPASYNRQFAPLSDRDLPPALKMCEGTRGDDFWEGHFHALAKSILLSL